MPGGYGNIKPTDNPKPFKKGESGNPHGRPPSLESIINKLWADGSDIEEVMEVVMKKAKKGDLASARELLDRIYGRVKQDVEVKGNIVLQFDPDDSKA